MTLTPKESLRLARADALMKKHGRCFPNYDLDGLGSDEGVFDASEVASLIDEACAVRDVTIAKLRVELNEAYKAEQEAARDGYAEGKWDAAAERDAEGRF